MLRFLAVVLGAAAVSATVDAASRGATAPFPEVIPLDGGFQPEGVEVGKGTTFYVGSRVTGTIAVGDLQTGEQTTLVQGGEGRPATGIELDPHNRLFVAGAGTGDAYVYDAETGDLLERYDFASTPPDTFVNDVVVTPKGAYFTDSRRAVLYKLALGPGGALPEDFEVITLAPELVNLNGIDATPDGKTLLPSDRIPASCSPSTLKPETRTRSTSASRAFPTVTASSSPGRRSTSFRTG